MGEVDKVAEFAKSLDAQLAAENATADAGEQSEVQVENVEIPETGDVPESVEDATQEDDVVEESDEELIRKLAEAKPTEENLEQLPRNVQKKINRETAARKQAEEENRKLQERLALLESNAQVLNQPAPVNTFGVQDDYFDESAIEHLPVTEQVKILLNREKQVEERKAQAEKSRQLEQAQNAQIAKLAQIASEKAERARLIFEDYDEVVAPVVEKLSPAHMLALPKTENMGKVMYYLGKNPGYTAELARIKDPMEIAMKLGKLDQKLSQKPATKKVSSAPVPMQKTGSTAGHGSKAAADVSKMSMKEFREMYKSL